MSEDFVFQDCRQTSQEERHTYLELKLAELEEGILVWCRYCRWLNQEQACVFCTEGRCILGRQAAFQFAGTEG